VGDLIADLGHPNLPVRLVAANQLVARGGRDAAAAIGSTLRGPAPVRARTHALWVLERLGALDDQTLLAAAGDPDRELRVHSLKILVDRPEPSAPLAKLARDRLNDPDPFVRRAAAEVLGAHPSEANLRPLLALRQSTPPDDTHLVHVARMALRDQLQTHEIWPQLQKSDLAERDRRDIADVATGVHTADASAFLLAQIQRLGDSHGNLLRHVHHIARYAQPGWMPALLAVAVAQKPRPTERLEIIRAMHEGAEARGLALDEAARSQAAGLARELLRSAQPRAVALAIDVIRDLRFRDMEGDLKQVIERAELATEPRIQAMGALAALDPRASLDVVARVLGDASLAPEMRDWAAALLGNMDLPEARSALLADLPAAPERLQLTIAAALVRRRPGAEALLGAIAQGKASARLLQDRAVALSLESSGLPGVSDRIAGLVKGLPPADSKLNALFGRRRDGFRASGAEPAGGAAVFRETVRDLPRARRQGGKGRPAARWHRQPRPRPAHGRYPRPQSQRRSNLPSHQPVAQERADHFRPILARGGRGSGPR
jgi:hypothetical protein